MHIEEIRALWPKIAKKTKFIEAIAEKIERKPLSLRSHWFGAFWSIPEEHQATVMEEMNKWIKNNPIK